MNYLTLCIKKVCNKQKIFFLLIPKNRDCICCQDLSVEFVLSMFILTRFDCIDFFLQFHSQLIHQNHTHKIKIVGLKKKVLSDYFKIGQQFLYGHLIHCLSKYSETSLKLQSLNTVFLFVPFKVRG